MYFKKVFIGTNKIIPIFSPLVLSTIFHFTFAKIQNESDYSGLVLFVSIITVISTLLLLGKELQYYQSNNPKELIKNDFFTLISSSIVISFFAEILTSSPFLRTLYNFRTADIVSST